MLSFSQDRCRDSDQNSSLRCRPFITNRRPWHPLWFSGWWYALLALALTSACAAAPVRGSIGALLMRDEGTGALRVRQVAADPGGVRSGLISGDRIKMIDGILVDDLGAARVQKLLRGDVGTKVTLTVLRGNEVLHLEIVRTPLATPKPK